MYTKMATITCSGNTIEVPKGGIVIINGVSIKVHDEEKKTTPPIDQKTTPPIDQKVPYIPEIERRLDELKERGELPDINEGCMFKTARRILYNNIRGVNHNGPMFNICLYNILDYYLDPNHERILYNRNILKRWINMDKSRHDPE